MTKSLWVTDNNNDYCYDNLNDGTVEIVRYLGKNSSVIIPSMIDGRKVSNVGYLGTGPLGIGWGSGGAFQGCKKVTSVTIPEGVKKIGIIMRNSSPCTTFFY